MQYLFPRCSLGTFAVLIAILATTSVVCGKMKQAALTETNFTENKIQNEETQLTPGQAVDRELKAGETHDYRIPLKTGEYLQVSIAELNIDVRYTLYEPHGKAIRTINWKTQDSPESLWFGADESGDYRLAITGVTVRGANAHYITTLVKVGELKTAPPDDQNYVRAYELFFQAKEFANGKDNESLRKTAEAYEQTLPLWRALKDPMGEAHALNELGMAQSRLGEPDKSREAFKQAIEIWRSTRNHERDEAHVLHNLAMLGLTQGWRSESMDALTRERELRRLLGDPKGQALALSNMGSVYYQRADFQSMLAVYDEALPLARASGDKATEALILSNTGAAYFSQGELQRAFDYSKQVLPLRQAAGDRRGESITLTNLGSIYRELGEPQKSLGYYQQALPLMRQVGDRSSEAGILENLGLSYNALGDYSKALEYHQEALKIRRELKEPSGEASALSNLGNDYARSGERIKALECFEQSLKLRRAIGDRRGEALTLRNTGELYSESGEQEKALVYFNDGLALSRTIKNRFLEANLLYDIARVEQRAGHFPEALARVEHAIAIVESNRARVASADLRTSFFASKQDFYELDIDLLMQSYRQDLNQENLVTAFSVSERRRARSLLDSLGEAQSNIRRMASPALLARERELRAKLNQKAESQIKLLSGQHTPAQAAALAKEVESVSTDYEQALAEIRASDPHYAALTQSAPLDLSALQTEILDPDTLLLEYSLGRERSYLWAVTRDDINGYELPGRAEIENQARNLYGLLTSRNRFIKFEKPDERQARIAKADNEYLQAAELLSQLLLGPLGKKIDGKRLLIVSDGALQYLPFAALPSPGPSIAKQNQPTAPEAYRPLIVDHEITSLPSAAILDVLRREVRNRKPAPKSVAVLADPVFSKTDERVRTAVSVRQSRDRETRSHEAVRGGNAFESDLLRAVRDFGEEGGIEIERLPSTRKEAEVILGLVPRADQFEALDFQANRSAATSSGLSQYRIVHFATHGLLNPTHPGLSGLILSLVDRQGNDQNGFLATHEIFDLNLPADLVVLSGCRTGLGKEIKGEGMLGLTRGFMYAGAARVAVSLWDVNDRSTAELMGKFYGEMLGKKKLSPAAAMRNAQVAMWKSRGLKAPYYWAAFVLQGEYR